jgi:hypothetical protein
MSGKGSPILPESDTERCCCKGGFGMGICIEPLGTGSAINMLEDCGRWMPEPERDNDLPEFAG